MLYFNLGPIFKARNIERPRHFLVKAGMSAFTASQFVNGRVTTFKLANIELLCKALFCEPNDLLAFAVNKGEIYPAQHPLLNLKREEHNNSINDLLVTMPFKQVKELTQTLITNNEANLNQNNEDDKENNET